MQKMLCCVLISFSVAFGARVFADTTGDPYTVDLGPGNEDLEEQINAVPWTQASFYPGVRVKDVSEIDFKGRDLRASRVRLLGDGLTNANFEGCRFDGSSFYEIEFYNCSFRNASMRYCEFSGLSVRIDATNDLSGADITGCFFRRITKDQLMQTKNYQRKSLSGVTLSGHLDGLSLSNFLLDNCSFRFGRSDVSLVDATLLRMSIDLTIKFDSFKNTLNYKNKDLSQLLFAGQLGSPNEHWDLSGCILGYFFQCDISDFSLHEAYFPPRIARQVNYLKAETISGVRQLYGNTGLKPVGLDRCSANDEKTNGSNLFVSFAERVRLMECLDHHEPTRREGFTTP